VLANYWSKRPVGVEPEKTGRTESIAADQRRS
jgi:hypothetical protein